MWKRFNEFFTYPKKTKNAILLLSFASITVFIVPGVYQHFKPVEHVTDAQTEKAVQAFIEEYNQKKHLAELSAAAEDSFDRGFNPYASIKINSHFKKKEKKAIAYFNFDPNTIGTREWMQLGFSEKQAESIEKLKAKGFKFYKPEDLKSVYVIDKDNYNRLSPYVRIDLAKLPNKEFPRTVYPEKTREKFVLDINTADSSLFERQRGIGPSLASRIVKYRNRLGGFVSTKQISEVWGMPDSTLQNLQDRLVVNETVLNKININRADIPTMGKHPYINFPLARVIEAYRRQHGDFKAVGDLKKVAIVTDSIYNKLQPYISVE